VAIQVWFRNHRTADDLQRPDGKQYVSVLAGVGGWAGAVVAGGLDTRDSSAALGFVNAVRDLPEKTTKGGMLYVFALP
jgi:alcohol dehydrogenase (cytochrome c)